MFIEIRKAGKKKKYYLIYSYRVGDTVKRISRYLGSDLIKKNLEKSRKRAEKIIIENVKENNILRFELTEDEIKAYRNYEKGIEVVHLQKLDWKRFTESFTYNTNAIEGSAVDLKDVKDLLGHKNRPENKDEQETLNVAKAVRFIKISKEKVSLDLIKKIHEICFNGTKSFAGKIREVEVVVKDSQGNIVHQGAPSKEVPKLLIELCTWYEKHKDKYPSLLLAALLHNQFENIHPFQDGNGRVGRLLLNYALLKQGYPPMNIYLKDRARYYKVLQDYGKTGDIKSTLRFLISQYKKQYK